MKIEVAVRGRFYPIPGARATHLAANVWELHIPKDDPIHARARRPPTAEGWDEAVFALDDVETQPAVGSDDDGPAVTVTVVILPG